MLMPILNCAFAVGANAAAESNAPAHRRLFNPRIWSLSYGHGGPHRYMGYGGVPRSLIPTI
jgi:hypothetical protein